MKKYKNACFKGVHYRKCWMCDKPITRASATVDHLLAKSEGGGDEWSNLRLACFPCNVNRGNNPLADSDREKLKRYDAEYHKPVVPPRHDFSKLIDAIRKERNANPTDK